MKYYIEDWYLLFWIGEGYMIIPPLSILKILEEMVLKNQKTHKLQKYAQSWNDPSTRENHSAEI